MMRSLLISLALVSLTACANSSQSSMNSTDSDAKPMQSMDHSKMSGGMSMSLGPADADFDLRFIDAMTPHHQGAIVMAHRPPFCATFR